MNIASNQTLILANERGVGGPRIAGRPRAGNAAGTSQLKRVTLVAAQPDSTVLYLQADYTDADYSSSGFSGASSRALAAAGNRVAGTTAVGTTAVGRPSGSGLPVPSSPAAPSGASNRGIALYASTQRGPVVKPYGHIDVHA